MDASMFQTGSRDGKRVSLPEAKELLPTCDSLPEAKELVSTCELMPDAGAREDSGRVFTLSGASTWVTLEDGAEAATYEGNAIVLAPNSDSVHWDQQSPGQALRTSNPLGWSCSPDMADVGLGICKSSVGLDLCKSIACLEPGSDKEKLKETCGTLRSVMCTLTDAGIKARRCKISNFDPEAEKASLLGSASASVSSSGPTTPRGRSKSDVDQDKAPLHPLTSPSSQGSLGNRLFSDDDNGTEVSCRWFFRDASWAHDESDSEEEEHEEFSMRRGRSFMLESLNSIPQEWSKSELPVSARCRLSAPLMERPKISPEEEEYDPRKPEYIRSATLEEETETEVELLRQQIRSLKGMIQVREGREPDSAVLDSYRRIIKQMERQIWHLEVETYIVPSERSSIEEGEHQVHGDMGVFYGYPTDVSTTDDSEVAWSGKRFLCGLDFGRSRH